MNFSPNYSDDLPTYNGRHPLMTRLIPSTPQQRSRGSQAEVANSARQGPRSAPRQERGNVGQSDELRIRQLVAGQIDGWHARATAEIERFQARFLAKFGMTGE